MKRKLHWFSLLLVLFSFEMFPQAYVITFDNKIYRIEPNYSTTYITTVNMPVGINLTDIAVSPSGIFYGASGSGRLIQINTATGNCIQLAALGLGTGLVCSNDNKLYYIRFNQLWEYDINAGVAQALTGTIGGTPGDLTLYKGNVIVQIDENFTVPMMAYNLETHSIVNTSCPEYFSAPRFYGLANVFTSCDGNKILGSDYTNTIFEIDLENGSSSPVVTLSGISSINGLASGNEYLASECASFSFSNVECLPLGLTENQKKASISIYPNPTSNWIQVENANHIHELNLFDHCGRMVKQAKNTNQLDLGPLQSGLYQLMVKSADGTQSFKIIRE